MVRNKNWMQIMQIIRSFEADSDFNGLEDELKLKLAPGDKVVINVKRPTILNPGILEESKMKPRLVINHALTGLRRVIPDARIVVHYDGDKMTYDTDGSNVLADEQEVEEDSVQEEDALDKVMWEDLDDRINKRMKIRIQDQKNKINILEKSIGSIKRENRKLRSIILMMQKKGVRDLRKSSLLQCLSREVEKSLSTMASAIKLTEFRSDVEDYGKARALLKHLMSSCDYMINDEAAIDRADNIIDDWAIEWEIERRLIDK